MSIPSEPQRGARGSVRLVSFSGIDGAGKSTQIVNLQQHLEGMGLRVIVIPFWDQVARLKRIREGAGHKIFRGDPGVGSPEAPIERRDKNVRSPGMTLVRLALYLVDVFSLRRVVARLRRQAPADVVIFDRYIYDEMANLDLRAAGLRLYVRTILRMAPRPDAGLVLDADPTQARARKPEYPLDFLVENRAAYLRLSRLAGLVTIPPLPIDYAKSRVVTEVLQRTGLEHRQR